MFISRIASAEFQHRLGTRTVDFLGLRVSQPAPRIIIELLNQTPVGIHHMSDASQVVPTNIVNFPFNTLFYVNYRGRIDILNPVTDIQYINDGTSENKDVI